jgi:hypothetical protein
MCDETPFEALLTSDDSEPLQGYMEINHFTNAVDDLRQAMFAISQLDRKFRWKWAVISLDRALYGFMICTLEMGNWANVMDYGRMPRHMKRELEKLHGDDSTEAYLNSLRIRDEYLRGPKPPPLINFGEALRRVMDPQRPLQYTFSKAIQVTDIEKESVDELHEQFRNTFAHFRPTSWLINELKFPPLLLGAVAVIRKILDSGMLISFRSSVEDAGETSDSIRLMLDATDALLKVNQRFLEKQQGIDGGTSPSSSML